MAEGLSLGEHHGCVELVFLLLLGVLVVPVLLLRLHLPLRWLLLDGWLYLLLLDELGLLLLLNLFLSAHHALTLRGSGFLGSLGLLGGRVLAELLLELLLVLVEGGLELANCGVGVVAVLGEDLLEAGGLDVPDLLLEEQTELLGPLEGLWFFLQVAEGLVPDHPDVLDDLDGALVVVLLELALDHVEVHVVLHDLRVVLVASVGRPGEQLGPRSLLEEGNELLALALGLLPDGGGLLRRLLGGPAFLVAEVLKVSWLLLSLRHPLPQLVRILGGLYKQLRHLS